LIEKNILTIAILEAVEKSVGCPLCYLWVKDEEGQMEYLLANEVTMDPGFRNTLISAKGFCNYHAHLLYKVAYTPGVLDGLGYALYMKDVVESVLESLGSVRLESMSKLENKMKIDILSRRQERRRILLGLYKAVNHAILGERPCPACESLRSSDEIHLDTLLRILDDDEFRKDFQSRALCLPHFLSAFEMLRSSKLRNSAYVARALLEVEKNCLQTVANYLSEFIRKQDWNARNESRGPEMNANAVALNLLAGAQGLYSGSRCDENHA
jgi:hypothetical protein